MINQTFSVWHARRTVRRTVNIPVRVALCKIKKVLMVYITKEELQKIFLKKKMQNLEYSTRYSTYCMISYFYMTCMYVCEDAECVVPPDRLAVPLYRLPYRVILPRAAPVRSGWAGAPQSHRGGERGNGGKVVRKRGSGMKI